MILLVYFEHSRQFSLFNRDLKLKRIKLRSIIFTSYWYIIFLYLNAAAMHKVRPCVSLLEMQAREFHNSKTTSWLAYLSVQLTWVQDCSLFNFISLADSQARLERLAGSQLINTAFPAKLWIILLKTAVYFSQIRQLCQATQPKPRRKSISASRSLQLRAVLLKPVHDHQISSRDISSR